MIMVHYYYVACFVFKILGNAIIAALKKKKIHLFKIKRLLKILKIEQ